MFLFHTIETEPGKQKWKDLGVSDVLLKDVGKGDNSAFEKLYRLTEKTVYIYALSILKIRQDAEDVMQDTYLKIRSAAHLYEPKGKPMAWILTITRNLSLMKLRQRDRYSDNYEMQMEQEEGFSNIKQKEDRIVLEAAFQILSEEERTIILLHSISGMKHKEIAKTLGKPLSTVLSKNRRGLKKLKSFLEEGGRYES